MQVLGSMRGQKLDLFTESLLLKIMDNNLSYQDSDMDTDTDPPVFLKPRIRIQQGNGKYKQYKY